MIGILFSNLGTPAAPTPAALRTFLREFLWDPRIVEMPRPLWWLILNGTILRTRPKQSARLYRNIWTEEGSPLAAITSHQTRALENELDARVGDNYRLAVGMPETHVQTASAASESPPAAFAWDAATIPVAPARSPSTCFDTSSATAPASASPAGSEPRNRRGRAKPRVSARSLTTRLAAGRALYISVALAAQRLSQPSIAMVG